MPTVMAGKKTTLQNGSVVRWVLKSRTSYAVAILSNKVRASTSRLDYALMSKADPERFKKLMRCDQEKTRCRASFTILFLEWFAIPPKNSASSQRTYFTFLFQWPGAL